MIPSSFDSVADQSFAPARPRSSSEIGQRIYVQQAESEEAIAGVMGGLGTFIADIPIQHAPAVFE